MTDPNSWALVALCMETFLPDCPPVQLFDTEGEAITCAVEMLLAKKLLWRDTDGTFPDYNRVPTEKDAIEAWQQITLGACEYFHVYPAVRAGE